MFKNFDKVFKFTFRNHTSPSGYKKLTTIMAIILFATPLIILSIVASRKKDDSVIKPCGVEKFYIVNEVAGEQDYSLLRTLGGTYEGYESIEYINADSVSAALDTITSKGERKSAVLNITEGEYRTSARIILPDDTDLSKKEVKNYLGFINKNASVFAVLSNGISFEALMTVSVPIETDVYTVSGKNLFEDEEALNEQAYTSVKPIFNMILIFGTVMIVYFMVIFYGNSIMQNIVLEKSSKLMDTMLVSVKPQAMIFGKMLGSLCAALMQFGIWVVCLIGGFAAGVFAADKINPNHNLAFIIFLKNFDGMGIFTPASVIIAIFVLLFGIVFYSTMAAICGAISSSREEAAGNQGIFTMILVISFYFVLFGGMKEDVALWMYLVPCTSAMILPAGVCVGTVSIVTSVISLAIMAVCTVLLVILAGKLYTMMSLYKGNKVNLVKALKMLAGKQ